MNEAERATIVSEPPRAPKRFTFLRRRMCWVPTWQGLIVILLLVALTGFVTVRNIYPFLALNDPIHTGSIVIEGWAADKTMQYAATEFRNGTYGNIYVIGGPIEKGTYLSSYTNFAQLGAATLEAQGVPVSKLHPVPAPRVPQDRTYISAVALGRYMELKDHREKNLHLISEGTHARRSRVLLKMALGRDYNIGVTAVPNDAFDPDRWWATSAGVKAVFGETLSYVYTRLLFRPK